MQRVCRKVSHKTYDAAKHHKEIVGDSSLKIYKCRHCRFEDGTNAYHVGHTDPRHPWKDRWNSVRP